MKASIRHAQIHKGSQTWNILICSGWLGNLISSPARSMPTTPASLYFTQRSRISASQPVDRQTRWGLQIKSDGSTHFSDVTWRLKTPAKWLFVQQLVNPDNKANINAPHHWALCEGILQWPVDSPHKWPVMRKTTTQFSVQQLVRATNRETTNARITDSLQGESSSDPQKVSTLWRHQMETFSALVALCAGNSPVPVNSPHKGQWRGALMFSLICAWTNGWVNNREAGDFRRHRAHCDVIVMNSETVSMSWRHGYTYWVHVAYNTVWCGQWSRSLYIPFQHLRLRPSRLHLVEISDPPINVVSSETRCILLQRRHCLHITHMRSVLPPLCHPWKKYHIRLWLLGDLSEMLWINSFFFNI